MPEKQHDRLGAIILATLLNRRDPGVDLMSLSQRSKKPFLTAFSRCVSVAARAEVRKACKADNAGSMVSGSRVRNNVSASAESLACKKFTGLVVDDEVCVLEWMLSVGFGS